jgi:gas vesicle protein
MRTEAVTVEPVSGDQGRNLSFVMGLIAGGAVGVGLGMLFAPRGVVRFRARAAGSARRIGESASDTYRQVSVRLGDAVDDLSKKGQGLREDLADVIARGVQRP